LQAQPALDANVDNAGCAFLKVTPRLYGLERQRIATACREVRQKDRPGAVGISLVGTRRPAAKRKNRPALRVPRTDSEA
jgi:hypothetical protein